MHTLEAADVEAAATPAARWRARLGRREWVAVLLLLLGGVLLGIGWASWALREKCVYPTFVSCEDPMITVGETALFAVTLIPIVTAIYLARRADLRQR